MLPFLNSYELPVLTSTPTLHKFYNIERPALTIELQVLVTTF